jgi:hypothetical protein
MVFISSLLSFLLLFLMGMSGDPDEAKTPRPVPIQASVSVGVLSHRVWMVSVTVRGTRYETVRHDLKQEGLGTVYRWFADGIGLVKEYSEDGGTIFAADVISGVALTEPVSHTK